jgi:hypothetical protein
LLPPSLSLPLTLRARQSALPPTFRRSASHASWRNHRCPRTLLASWERPPRLASIQGKPHPDAAPLLLLAAFLPLSSAATAACGGINPYTPTAKLGLAWIDGFSPPKR